MKGYTKEKLKNTVTFLLTIHILYLYRNFIGWKIFYQCNEAWVVTNNIFTKGAIELAAANGVILKPQWVVVSEFN